MAKPLATPTIADRAPGSTAMTAEAAPYGSGQYLPAGAHVVVTGTASGAFVLVRPWDPEARRWVGPIAIPSATRIATAADDLPSFGGGR